jgi:hypothetical protein
MRAAFPSHPILVDLICLIISEEEYKLCNFYSPVSLSLFGQNILLEAETEMGRIDEV